MYEADIGISVALLVTIRDNSQGNRECVSSLSLGSPVCGLNICRGQTTGLRILPDCGVSCKKLHATHQTPDIN